jgi:hypothetical protein
VVHFGKSSTNGVFFHHFANSKLKAGDVLEVEHQKESLRSFVADRQVPLYLEAESLLSFTVGFEKRT